jgi:hypothetical protein
MRSRRDPRSFNVVTSGSRKTGNRPGLDRTPGAHHDDDGSWRWPTGSLGGAHLWQNLQIAGAIRSGLCRGGHCWAQRSLAGKTVGGTTMNPWTANAPYAWVLVGSVRITQIGRGTVRAMIPGHATVVVPESRVQHATPAIGNIHRQCPKDTGLSCQEGGSRRIELRR